MIKIFFHLKAQYLKTQMEYTANFWMMIISGIIMQTLFMGVVFVLFHNIPDVAGWQAGEMYLILGFMFASNGLNSIFADGIWHIPALVFRGNFDVMLSRPVPPLYQVLSYEIGLQGIGDLAMGVLSLGIGLTTMGWLTFSSIILCAFFVLTGTVIRLSYNLISLSLVFWIHNGLMNAGFLVHSIGEYAKYPVIIFPGWVRFILFFIIPAGFIGFVPALIIRGDGVVVYTLVVVVVTILYFFLAKTIFYRGIRRYESMGM